MPNNLARQPKTKKGAKIVAAREAQVRFSIFFFFAAFFQKLHLEKKFFVFVFWIWLLIWNLKSINWIQSNFQFFFSTCWKNKKCRSRSTNKKKKKYKIVKIENNRYFLYHFDFFFSLSFVFFKVILLFLPFFLSIHFSFLFLGLGSRGSEKHDHDQGIKDICNCEISDGRIVNVEKTGCCFT